MCGKNIPAERIRRRITTCSPQCKAELFKKRHLEANHNRPAYDFENSVVGTISELVVCLDLMKRGYSVFRPMNGCESCDIIALKGGKMIRVEVTTGVRCIGGTLTHKKKRPPGEVFDILGVVERNDTITYSPKIPE